jgi:hypothetical protein
VARARASFARLHGVDTGDVAIGHHVSPLVWLVAGSLPRGARVLAAEGNFTSRCAALRVQPSLASRGAEM